MLMGSDRMNFKITQVPFMNDSGAIGNNDLWMRSPYSFNTAVAKWKSMRWAMKHIVAPNELHYVYGRVESSRMQALGDKGLEKF